MYHLDSSSDVYFNNNTFTPKSQYFSKEMSKFLLTKIQAINANWSEIIDRLRSDKQELAYFFPFLRTICGSLIVIM